MFTCITPEMMLREQRINDLILKLERIIHPIPPIAIKQFFTSCLRDEIKATNDIEGVHSSRKEIDYALEQQQHPEEKKIHASGELLINTKNSLLMKTSLLKHVKI